MPEFYDHGTCRYQLAAQPYLAAIARGMRDEVTSRMFLLDGTERAQAYADAEPLWEEQWKKRDPTDSMTCPFWSNYWYEPCQSCDCRIDKFCGVGTDIPLVERHFDRVILHEHARNVFPKYPA